jgi:chromosomal replication initiation ATPase DnaA
MIATQLALDLPVRAALGREDFFVAQPNALALATVDGWCNWPGGRLVLVGPEGSGKTHLAHVWAAAADATIQPAQTLTPDMIESLSDKAVVIEDADRIARGAEASLFHLHNLVLAQGGRLLLTARVAPTSWPLSLPDLASRMQAAPLARLEAPDDGLLSAVLVKHFADRQIAVSPKLIDYLLGRMDRSLAAAAELVAQLDRRALAERCAVTIRLARSVLDSDKEHGR